MTDPQWNSYCQQRDSGAFKNRENRVLAFMEEHAPRSFDIDEVGRLMHPVREGMSEEELVALAKLWNNIKGVVSELERLGLLDCDQSGERTLYWFLPRDQHKPERPTRYQEREEERLHLKGVVVPQLEAELEEWKTKAFEMAEIVMLYAPSESN